MSKESKSKSKQSKDQKKEQQRELILKKKEAETAIHTALQADFLQTFFAFKTRKTKLVDVSLNFFKQERLSPALKDWMFKLLETNMKAYYAGCKGWGWKPRVKQRELCTEPESRYFIITQNHSTPSSSPSASTSVSTSSSADSISLDDAVGFLHFRFEIFNQMPLLYLYEIQLSDTIQRKGLGKFLMQLLELIAWKYGMRRLVLTVFKANQAAVNFYKTLGYAVDAETDPNPHGMGAKSDQKLDEDDVTDDGSTDGVGYEILSKANPKVVKT